MKQSHKEKLIMCI